MEIPDLDFNTPNLNHPLSHNQELELIDSSYSQTQIQELTAQEVFQQDFNPIIQDTIQKKTMNVSWTSRYFSLTKTRVLYYCDWQKKQLKGCFNLVSLSKYKLEVKEEQQPLRLTLTIYLDFNSQNYTKQLLSLNFQSNPSKLTIWKKQLQDIIKNVSQEKILQAPSINPSQIVNTHQKIQGYNFWNKIAISINELQRFASHLDIVFFRSKSPISTFHRLFMRSKFDHVGLLFKDSFNRLLILQAIESRGVWINQWNHLLPTFKQHYDQIGIRKLLLGKQFKLEFKKLEDLVDAVIGRKYQLSLSKLIIGQKTTNFEQIQLSNSEQKQNKNRQQKVKNKTTTIQSCKKQKTYFCSQLIGDIYIKMGIIKGKKRNQLWPCDFEDDSIHLQGNCKFSQFMFLDF